MATHESPLRTVGVGYGLGLAGAVLAVVLVLPPVLLLGLLGLGSLPVRLVVGFVFGQYLPFMGFPLVYFRLRGFDWGAIRDYLGVRVPSLKEVGVVVAGFVAVFVLAFGSSWLVTQVLGLTAAENSSAELARDSPSVIPILIAASILVIGPCEETLFRGAVQNRLRESFSAPVAITLAAVLFAAVHVIALTGGVGAQLTTVAILLFPSFVFGTVYEYTGNLVVPALIHGLWDAFLFTAIWIYLSVGGEFESAGSGAALALLSAPF